MTREEARAVPGFSDWCGRQDTKTFLTLMGEVVDEEVGASGYPINDPHLVHINFGVQDAVRRVRGILRDPTAIKIKPTPTLPPARYGVKTP